MHGLKKHDWKGLWAVSRRILIILIFGPILWILGLGLLMLVIAAFFAPPLYAAHAFYTGDRLFGVTALVVWFVVLRFRRPTLRWTFEGLEYGSI